MIRPAPSLFFILLIVATHLPAQNIVPNGRFDEVNICTEFHYRCAPKAWFYCSVNAHANYGAYRISPDTLRRGLDILAADRDLPTRQYWETRLLCPLQTGAHYRVRLKVSATNEGPNLHDIGFYFTDKFIFTPVDTLIQPPSYLGFLDAAVHDLGFGWFELEKKFTATGNEAFLVIGNFAPESNTQIVKKRGTRSVNVIVTDLRIEPLDAPLCSDFQRTKDTLYAITNRHSFNRSTGWADLVADIHLDTVATVATVAPPSAPHIPHIDTLRIPDIDFALDSYHPIDSNLLDKYRSTLEDQDISHILVAGYTDQSGSAAYNLQLSEKRALEIARLLSGHYNLDASLITAEGRGVSTLYK